MVSNSFSHKIVSGLIAGSMLMPLLAGAQETTTAADPAPRELKNVCDNIVTLRDRALSRLATRVSTIQGKRGEHQTKFQTGRTERHTTLANNRVEHDTARKAHYDKLTARASTTEQTAAVTTFASEVERLVTVRKAAVDVAIATFEDGVAALQAKSDAAVSTFSTTMQADITQIYDDAKVSCAGGTKGSDVISDIKEAMAEKKTARDSDSKAHTVRDEFKALQAARKASVDAAQAKFRTDFETAKTKLKAAFPKKSA
jgi:hypothetical protein